MKKIFLDTNVVIDFLANRQPFSIDAAKLFDLAENKQVEIFISAVSYNNIYYIIRQSLTATATIKLLEELTTIIQIAAVTDSIIKQSLKSGFSNFEDAIQYYCALAITEIDFIVTRDAKGFKKSVLSILTPSEALVFF